MGKELSREMESLKLGLKDLAVDAHRDNYARLMHKLDEALADVDALKNEFSGFVNEIKNNKEEIDRLRSEITDMKTVKIEPPMSPPPEGFQSSFFVKDMEALKTRIKWLESKASLPNIEELKRKVESLEGQIGSSGNSAATIIE